MYLHAALQSTQPFLLECMTLLFLLAQSIAPSMKHNATASGHISTILWHDKNDQPVSTALMIQCQVQRQAEEEAWQEEEQHVECCIF